MTAPAPSASVVLAVYNGMPWLPVSAESILSQSYRDLELLLVDDGSTDGSRTFCDGLAARDSRVRVVAHPNGANCGQVASLNLGLAEARSAYVARMDADDIAYPTRLERQVAFLDAHPGVALVGSQVDWAGPWGTSRWDTPTEAHLARWTLLLENCFMHGGVTMRTSAAREAGGYDETFATAEDYDLWLRLAERHDTVNLPETLSWFNRLRDDNLSTVHLDRQEDAVFRLSGRAIRQYLPNVTDEEVRDLYYVGRGWPWPQAPAGSHLLRRLASVSRVLVELNAAFLRRHRVPRTAQGAIRADRNKRLMRTRLALASAGGIGQLARLHRPRWDRRAMWLRVPYLLSIR